jgi:hypothetical protein
LSFAGRIALGIDRDHDHPSLRPLLRRQGIERRGARRHRDRADVRAIHVTEIDQQHIAAQRLRIDRAGGALQDEIATLRARGQHPFSHAGIGTCGEKCDGESRGKAAQQGVG